MAFFIAELNAADGAKTIEDVNILKEWANEYGVGDKLTMFKHLMVMLYKVYQMTHLI